jgi:hypothetical protein
MHNLVRQSSPRMVQAGRPAQILQIGLGCNYLDQLVEQFNHTKRNGHGNKDDEEALKAELARL